MMKKTIVVTGFLVLALTGFGASAAMANTSISPSTPTGSSTPAVVTAPASTPTGSKSDVEVPDSTEVSGTESASNGDGNDGGHADPEGVDVNNQAGETEK